MLRRPRATTPTLLLLATVVTTAVITGCGHSVTRNDVIARANAICFTAQQAARSVAAPGGAASDTKALAAYFDKVTIIVAEEARQLAALPRPKQRQATLDHYVDAVDASVTDYRAAARAAAAGDDGGVTQALARLRLTGATRDARAYGLGQCTGSASDTS
jgi:hypothetical protein